MTEKQKQILSAKMNALGDLYASLKKEAEETGTSVLRYEANHVNERRNELQELISDLGARWNGHEILDRSKNNARTVAETLNELTLHTDEASREQMNGAYILAVKLGYECHFDPLENTFTVTEK